MNSIHVEPEEKKRRAKETQAIIKRNATLLKQCGFYQMTEGQLILDEDGKSTGIKHRWCCGPVEIRVCDHEFHKAGDVIEAVNRIAFEKGGTMARDEMRRALRL